MKKPLYATVLLALALSACSKRAPEENRELPESPDESRPTVTLTPDLSIPSTSPVTEEVIERYAATEHAVVRHILISWGEKAPAYSFRGGQDPRGEVRSREEANRLVHALIARFNKGIEFEVLMKDFSEDRGSAATGRAYTATPTASLTAPFRDMALRLNPGETGVVETDFGYHIMLRTE